jgi:putative oxidoreductase
MLSTERSNIFKEAKFPNKIIILLLRVILGGALFIKGVDFIRNKVILHQVIAETDLLEKFSVLEAVIPWIHLLGGLFIIIGMYTRLVIFIQIPLVIGAIIVLYNTKNSSFYSIEMMFAVTILIMLFIYLKFGDGFYSWRNLINKEILYKLTTYN